MVGSVLPISGAYRTSKPAWCQDLNRNLSNAWRVRSVGRSIRLAPSLPMARRLTGRPGQGRLPGITKVAL
jgi:hypothetical protein